MTKKSKCATALLATALISYGFTLDRNKEITTPEPETTAEAVTEIESIPVTQPQHLVAEEEIQVKIFEEEHFVEKVETESLPSETPPQVTTLKRTQANTAEQSRHQHNLLPRHLKSR